MKLTDLILPLLLAAAMAGLLSRSVFGYGLAGAITLGFMLPFLFERLTR